MNEPDDHELLEQVKEMARPAGEDFWTRYEKRRQKAKFAPRTPLQEAVEPYLKYMVWADDTFEKDMALFWIACTKHEKTHPSGSLIKVLEWMAHMNRLHPLQVVKALNRPYKPQNKGGRPKNAIK